MYVFNCFCSCCLTDCSKVIRTSTCGQIVSIGQVCMAREYKWRSFQECLLNASPLLKQLQWLPIKEVQRVFFKTMLYIFRCLAGWGPAYLTSGLTLYKPGHDGLRSANDSSHLTEFTNHNWTLVSAADKGFFYAAPKQWNKFPVAVRSSGSVTVFKKALRHHLFHKLCFCILLVLCICLCIIEYIPYVTDNLFCNFCVVVY